MGQRVVVLVGCRDHRSLYRFPTDEGEFHGFEIFWDQETDKTETVIETIKNTFSLPDERPIRVLTFIENQLKSKSGEIVQLAIADVDETIQAPEEWMTLPLILRAMGKGSNRLAYNKAMQVFAGAMSQETDALEVDDEVKQRLRELAEEEES